MIFLVVTTNEAAMAPLVEKAFPDENLSVGPGQWLVSVSGTPTSKDVWEKIEGGVKPPPPGIVVSTNGYYGYAENNVWEWIAAKRQAAS